MSHFVDSVNLTLDRMRIVWRRQSIDTRQEATMVLTMRSTRCLLAGAARLSASHAAQTASPPSLALRLSGVASRRSPALAMGPRALFSSVSAPPQDSEEEKQTPQQQIEALLAENAALKKEVETLKEQLAKKPGKLMATIQQFGMPFLIWWTTLYFASGAGLYLALDTGLLAGDQAIEFIMSLGLDKFVDPARLDPKYGNLAIAIIVNEALEVVRFPITVATIPYVKRAFSRSKEVEAK
jgi:hypothetical protein